MANKYEKIIAEKKSEAERIMTEGQVVKCNVAIHTASAAAGAEAFIPIPCADAVPITATQVTMIIALGKIFNQKISESAAKAIVRAAASTFIGRSLVKLIPFAGWVVSAAVAAGVTEAIGWATAVDFAKQAKVEKNIEDSFSKEAHEDETDDSSNEEDLNDESIIKDFSGMFGEDK